MKGTIKTWHHRKGFGFIEIDDGEDVFLHITDVPEKQKPEVGETVTFDIGPGRDGKTKAINVQLDSQASGSAVQANSQAKGTKFGLVLILTIVIVLIVGALAILL